MGYVFGDTAAGELPFEEKPERRGSHGHDPNFPDLRATFVAAGAGIRPGVELELIDNTAVAPTIAALLGFEIPNAESPPLASALIR
jgi:predicted AlkP superfamily pyrophosphatase or phosphodiesterase